MNKEQLKENLKKTNEELVEAKANYERLVRKEEMIMKMIKTWEEFEEEERFNFDGVTSTLSRFLKSDCVTIDPKLYCRQKMFIASYNNYCKENNLKCSKLTHQFCSGPFADFGIRVNNERKRYPNAEGNKLYKEDFVFGVDVKNQNFDIQESDEE